MGSDRNQSPTLTAGGNIYPFRFVKMGASDMVGIQADANAVVLGISDIGGRNAPGVDANSQYHAMAGDGISLLSLGDVGYLQAGSGGWTKGDRLKSDANGKGVPIAVNSSGEENVGAIALEDAAADEIARVQVVLQSVGAINESVTGNIAITGTLTGTAASATALTYGRQGATNPAIKVATNVSSCTTGWEITARAGTAGADLAVISDQTNENGVVNAKGTGTLTLNGQASGGNVVIGSALAFGTDASAAKSIVIGTTNGLKIGTATSQKLAFFNSTPIVKPAVTGARDAPEEALANLLTQLALLGLITNSTTDT